MSIDMIAACVIRGMRAVSLRWRTLMYRFTMQTLGPGSYVCRGVIVHFPRNVSVGANCIVNENATLQGSPGGRISIGDRVTISFGAMVLTASRKYQNGVFVSQHEYGNVTIKDGAWVAAGAIVLPGVTIGENAVVAAGAVVTRDVPPAAVVAGVPARLLVQRSESH